MTHSKHFITLLFLATLSLSFAQDVPQNLALRLAGIGGDANLTVGKLPEDLPLLLSLPEEVEVVGSLTEHYEERGAVTTLYLEARGERARVRDDLAARLQLAGLTVIPQGDSWGWGFASNSRPYDRSEFCRDDLYASVVFYENARATGIDMRLETIPPERGFECEGRREGMRDEHAPPVPILHAPSDVRAFEIDGGRTFMGEYSAVALEAGLDLAALSEHYVAQLEEAGWQRMNGDATSSVVWTQWRYEDDRGNPWTGFMQILGNEVFPEQTIAYLFVVQM